jgi:hypothetical protein
MAFSILFHRLDPILLRRMFSSPISIAGFRSFLRVAHACHSLLPIDSHFSPAQAMLIAIFAKPDSTQCALQMALVGWLRPLS